MDSQAFHEEINVEDKTEICKLAAAVEDDGRTIFPKMFGMAPAFAIYSFVLGKGFKFLEIRSNPYQKTLQRGKTFDVYELVNDCQALLAGRIGKKGIARLRDKGVRLFFGSGDVNTHLRKIEKC
jgi:predicted Fe-Mo cluster-binding NifX family protein